MGSTLMSAYLACLGMPDSNIVKIVDASMEIAFALDIARNFLMEYTLPSEPGKPIRTCSKIAIHYVKGPFIFDFIA